MLRVIALFILAVLISTVGTSRVAAQIPPNPTDISISDFLFQPTPYDVSTDVDGNVVWINDKGTHTVTFVVSDPIYDSGLLVVGQTYVLTVNDLQNLASGASVLNYFCAIHGAAVMSGAINVLPTPVAPTVTSLTPATGSTIGGNNVLIAGADLTGASSVTFGGVNASSFTVDSDLQITAVAPAGTGGVDVVVMTPAAPMPTL